MKTTFCDVCKKKVEQTESDAESLTGLEMYDQLLPGVKYCWGRFGIINVDLCPKHRKEALINFIKKMADNYDIQLTVDSKQ